MISVNRRGAAIVQKMIDDHEALGLAVRRLRNGTIVLDAGVEVPGSFEAGRLFACACLGGLAEVRLIQQALEVPDGDRGSGWVPAVAVSVSHPHIACMASQYAGWAIKLAGYFAIGSGPARALYAGEEIYRNLDYTDQAEAAVLMLESRRLPDEKVGSFVAKKCKVSSEQVTLLIAPTASIVGSVQIAARSAETGLHKIMELGFDVRRVTSAFGLCPLAPVAADDPHAVGRTNDAILYGAQVFYTVHADDAELENLIDKIPSASSRDYGTPFYKLLKRYNYDFYQIDPMLFSPAQVEINNLNSGHTFRAGSLNPTLLYLSLLEG
jgi:methenyltetrahydromethanopterin cyclohydrolase